MIVRNHPNLSLSLIVVYSLVLSIYGVCSHAYHRSDVSGANSLGTDGNPDQLGYSVLSGIAPMAVNLPKTVKTPVAVRPWFDLFSWQMFIAMNWPVDPQQRGVPLDPSKPNAFLSLKQGAKTTVWGSYREAYELFNPKAEPPAWNAEQQGVTPCDDNTGKVLLMATKASTLLNETNEAFSYPLIDQNKNYARYEIRFDQPQYDFINNNSLYLAKNLMRNPHLQMPAGTELPYKLGAIMVKAGWRQMITGQDDFSRYYVVHAQIYDPVKKSCYQASMGLVGLHIAAKLEGFPEWIWSTFGQVDNIPPDQGPAPASMSFNNAKATPKTVGGWADRPDYKSPNLIPESDKDKRIPTQVTRLNPIPTTPVIGLTVAINKVFRGNCSAHP